MQAHAGAAGRHRRCRARALEPDGDGEAFEAAPGIAEAEQLQRIEEGVALRLADAVDEVEGEEAGGAGEIPLPDGVARVALQPRMAHAGDLGPLLQPAGDLQAVLHVAAQAHVQRAQAAQGQIDVVRAHMHAERAVGLLQARPGPLAGGHRAEHRVGMADQILGAGLHRQVDAVADGIEEAGRRPGVVHDHQRVMRMGDPGDGRDVLHLEGEGARRLGHHGAGVGSEQRLDSLADGRIVIVDGNAEPLQRGLGEIAGRAIGAVGDQHVIAGGQARQQRDGDGVEARGGKAHAGRTLQFGQRFFQRIRRRIAAPGIVIGLAAGEHGRAVRKQHRGGVNDGRIDESVEALGLAPGVGERGCKTPGTVRLGGGHTGPFAVC